MFTVVDFDVSVVAETKGGGKGGIKVWEVEAGGGLEREGSQHEPASEFAVHVKLPQGTETPTQVFLDPISRVRSCRRSWLSSADERRTCAWLKRIEHRPSEAGGCRFEPCRARPSRRATS